MKKILLAMLFGAMTLTSFAEGKLKVVAAYGGKEKIFQQFRLHRYVIRRGTI